MKHPLDELEVSPHPKPFVASEPTPTGEPWTVGKIYEITGHPRCKINDDDFGRLCTAINASLAAKDEYIAEIRTTTYSDLEKQLAAEREATKQAWREHDDNVAVLVTFNEIIKQLGAANQQLRTELAAAQAAGLKLARLLRDEYWAQTPMDVAKLAAEILQDSTAALDAAMQPLVDALEDIASGVPDRKQMIQVADAALAQAGKGKV